MGRDCSPARSTRKVIGGMRWRYRRPCPRSCPVLAMIELLSMCSRSYFPFFWHIRTHGPTSLPGVLARNRRLPQVRRRQVNNTILRDLLKDTPLVITGCGVISAAGESVEELWDSVVAGRSPALWRQFEVGGGVRNFAICAAPRWDTGEPELQPVRHMDRSAELAWLAAAQAWRSAHLDEGPGGLRARGCEPVRCGLGACGRASAGGDGAGSRGDRRPECTPYGHPAQRCGGGNDFDSFMRFASPGHSLHFRQAGYRALLGCHSSHGVVICIEALRWQVSPPTANCLQQDPDCPINVQPTHAQQIALRRVMSDFLGFWGYHASSVFERVDGQGDNPC